MGGPRFDFMANPLGAVRISFEAACKEAATPQDLGRTEWGVKNLFEKFLLEDGMLDHVPEINNTQLHLLPAKSLVRYRGMVQDMFNVEYYVGAHKDGDVWRTTKYCDIPEPPIRWGEVETEIWDRRLYYCVPVPGESPWLRQALAQPNPDALKKESSEDLPGGSQRDKRQREEDGSAAEAMDTTSSAPTSNGFSEEVKRQREGRGPSASDVPDQASSTDLHFPLGPSSLHPCLIKVYDNAEADLKLNDVVEFVGIMTFDPELSAGSLADRDEAMDGADFAEDDINSKLPSSRVPRLHCIWHRKLSGLNPLLRLPGEEENALAAMRPSAGSLREALIERLGAVLGGDRTAAECVLLHMLSRVHTRVEPKAIGKLALNLTGLREADPILKSLTEALTLLLPRTHSMSLSLQLLSGKPFAPRKDYGTNRLAAGPLQLAEGTYLVVDETQLQAGQLSDTGVRNVKSLSSLMEWQKVEYDFQFYTKDMACDVPVLVLSQAKSRLLPCDLVVPVRASAEPVPLSTDEPMLDKWRLYLSLARRLEHSVGTDVQQKLESELVAARQEDRTVGPEVFHRWLTLARLMALACGESELTMEHWRTIRSLDTICEARLRVC